MRALFRKLWNVQMCREEKSVQIINIFLFIGMLSSLFFYIIFNRSLHLDGSHNLLRIIADHSFYELEQARRTFYIIQQFPVWIFIHFIPSASLSILIKLFSFGLVWIHLISFLGCYLILPVSKKNIIFFPLFAFLTGPLTALDLSISASLSVCSYIWLIVFLIYYSNLSLKIHRLFFILAPLPLLLSHELMSYMAWPLIFLCIVKLKKEDDILNYFLIKCLISFLLVCSLLSIFFILFPNKSEIPNRTEFFTSLFYLEFFIKMGDKGIDLIYPATISAFFLLALPFSVFIKRTYRKFYSRMCLFLLALFGIIALISPFYNLFNVFRLTNEQEARVWAACFALPLSILIWWLFENKVLKFKKEVFAACLITLISLIGWRIGSDYRFYQFQKQISKSILHCKGVVDWNEIIQQKELPRMEKSDLFYLTPYSLFIQPKNEITTVLTGNKNNYLRLLSCPNKNCPIFKEVPHCYFKNTFNNMCQYFNLYFLDQSRFFNLKPLIQFIEAKESYCLN